MAIEIQPYSTLLSTRLTSPQNLQFVDNIVKDAGPDILTLSELTGVYGALTHYQALCDTAFRHTYKMYETKAVKGRDDGRDYTIRIVANRIASFANYPDTDQEGEEAGQLQYYVELYKNADNKEYETETKLVRSLIRDLRKYPALLVKYGVKDLVDKLEVQNDEFDDVYNARNMARLEIKEKGDSQSLRRGLNASFDNVCKVITGMMLMPIADDVKAKLVKIVGIININIDQFNEIYHRHAGIVAKHHKKDGDSGAGSPPAGGAQPPDATNPPAPGTPPQNPDTTVPPAPDTPPQTPIVTPPTIDPDELNPPAVGER